MHCKILEIRDRATFIPVLCASTIPDNEEQRYLLRRCGYSMTSPLVIMTKLDAKNEPANYSPYGWLLGSRTFPVAHSFIENNWDELKDGDVIDVEFILGETAEKKVSERITESL